jgi:hypothetical protein
MVLALALTTAVSLPSLRAGFFEDDHVLVATLEGFGPWMSTPSDLWRFASGVREDSKRAIRDGAFPWWTDPEWRMALWRPLPSALMRLDHALAGRSSAFFHAHSLLWNLLFVFAAGLVLRRLFRGPFGGVALLLLAGASFHPFSAVWISARHYLVAGAFGFLAVWAHLRWKDGEGRGFRGLSLLSIALSLAGGESSLQFIGYLFAVEWVATGESRWARARRLVSPALVVLAWGLLYVATGHGVRADGHYLDPLDSPVRFAEGAVHKLPVMLSFLAMGPWVMLFTPEPSDTLILECTGLLILGLLIRASLRTAGPSQARAVKGTALGALLSLAPALAAPEVKIRLLIGPALGCAVLLTVLLRAGLSALRPSTRMPALARVVAGLFGVLVFFAHALAAPLGWAYVIETFSLTGRAEVEVLRRTEIPPGSRAVVVLVAPGLVFGPWGSSIRRLVSGAASPPWCIVSMGEGDHEVLRTGEDRLELRALSGDFAHGFTTARRRRGSSLRPGDEIEQLGQRFRVLAAHEGVPSRVEARLAHPLDDPSLVLLTWRDGGLKRIAIPAAGEPLFLPAANHEWTTPD